MAQATFVHEGKSIDYTPGSAVAAGDVVVQSNLVGVAKTPVATNALGALAAIGSTCRRRFSEKQLVAASAS